HKAYVGTLLATLKDRLFLPDKPMYSDLRGCGNETLDKLVRGINQPEAEVSVAFAKILAGTFPKEAVAIILKRASTLDSATADRTLNLLTRLDSSAHADELRKLGANGDLHLKTTVMRLLLDKGDQLAIADAITDLDSKNPRMQSTAIHAALRYPDAHDSRDKAIASWQTLLQSGMASHRAAMDNIPDLALLSRQERQSLLTGYLNAFTTLFADHSERSWLCTLQGLHHWKDGVSRVITDAVVQHLASENPALRQAAVSCLHLIDDKQRHGLILKAIGDGHISVRKTGIGLHKAVSERHKEHALDWISGNHASLRAQQTLLESLRDAHLPRSVLEKIARSKSEEMLLLQDAYTMLKNDSGTNGNSGNAARSLLQYTLKEQLDQTIELVLLALESLYNRETIRIIHAGFSSGDSHHIANASEVLGNMDKDPVISNLNDVLQKSAGEHSEQKDRLFESIDDVLRWCASHDSSWLSQCGRQALQPMKAGDTYA
ncbi:MAG: hypothetical protein GQ537_08515, partial [Gammaproteobacteria bacterium]|nr:hypothetical protein [Gammaproteobacteria bacterium]